MGNSLTTKPFDYYEFDSFNKTNEELIEEINIRYKKFHPSFNIYELDLNNFEVLVGIISGVMDWRSYTNLSIREEVIEFASELIRRKIEKIRKD